MSQADQIRETALAEYSLPARTAGDKEVTIRAGDLHRHMKLRNAMPSVCSALRGGKSEDFAGVRRVEVSGPVNGANVYFLYALTDQGDHAEQMVSPAPVEVPSHGRTAIAPAACAVDLTGALVLVSCVKSKLPQPAPARLLYCSDLFTEVRRLIEAQDARWFILSALHGLLQVDEEIAPYELASSSLGCRQIYDQA